MYNERMQVKQRSSYVTVRVTPQAHRRLERIAKRSGLGTSTVVRCLIANAPDRLDLADYVEQLAELGDAEGRPKS